MAPIVFTNISVFDGTGAPAFLGEIRIEGERIATVSPIAEPVSRDGATVLDGRGGTVMPGLVEAHAHLTFPFSVGRPSTGFIPPATEQGFATINAARVLLEAGYTSAYSGGSMNAELEVGLKHEIAAGRLPGPRLRASSFERAAGGMPGHSIDFDESLAGPEALAAWVGEMADLGCDNVKLILSGRSAVQPQYWDVVNYKDDAVAAATQVGRERGLKLSCHAMTPETVKQAALAGFDIIYHANFADEEALDLLEARKESIFVAPAIGIVYADVYDGGFTLQQIEDRGSQRALDGICETYQAIRKRGISVLPGGDYGFPHNPHGTEARDLQHFVDLLGYSPTEVLSAATMLGGRLMGMGDELGLLRPGYLADLLLIDGDPTSDVSILQDQRRIAAIMQGGRFHKTILSEPVDGNAKRTKAVLN